MNINNSQPLNRWTPRMESSQYRTFMASAPLTTHFRPATCREVSCAAYENGWSFDKAVLTPSDYYRVTHSGKRYREVNIGPNQTYLVFESGQFCFDKHTIRLQRPEEFFTGRGDWRTFNIHHAKRIKSSDEFADRLGTHLEVVKEVIKRG